MQQNARDFWQRRARRVAWRRNVAAWLAGFLPVVCAWAVLLAVGILVCRQAGWDWLPVGFVGVIGIFGCAGWAAWLARSGWISRADALVQIDDALGLHNRLTAAEAGVGSFPAPLGVVTDGTRWNWRRLLPPVGVAFGSLALAAWVPVSPAPDLPTVVEPPAAWSAVESWTEELAEAGLLDEATRQDIEEKVTTLREQPTEEWFSHGSLEAGDSLHEQVGAGVRELEQELRSAASALGKLAESGDQMNAAELTDLAGEYSDAVSGLELGRLPLNREILADLKAIDPRNVRQISAEELSAMKERLETSAGVCSAVGTGPGRPSGEMMTAEGAGSREAGMGGIQRGPGTQPLTLNSTPTELGGGQLEAISNPDLGRALPGEVLGLSAGEHDPVAEPDGAQSGGAVASAGAGGDAVWRDNLTPDETAALQRYFR